MPLNKILEETNNLLTKYIGQNKIKGVHEKLFHIINTIMKIPEMYKGDTYNTEIESDIIKIFTEVAMTSSFPSDDNNSYVSMTEQQNKLEQLIERTRSKINDELLKGVTDKLVIAPNKSGWGPKIPSGSGTYREPTDLEKIMEENDASFKTEINSQYNEALNEVMSINTSKLDDTVIYNINNLRELILNEMFKLIFGYGKNKKGDLTFDLEYGKDVSSTKIFILATWNHYIQNYPTIFADIVMDNLKLINANLFTQIKDGNSDKPIYTPIQDDHAIFSRNVSDIIRELSANGIDTDITNLLNGFLKADYLNIESKNICIAYKLKTLFSNSKNRDTVSINLLEENLGKIKLGKLVQDPKYSKFANIINNSPQLKNDTWFDALYNFISRILPKRYNPKRALDVDISGYFIYNMIDVFYDENTENLQIPLTPLPSSKYIDPWDENNSYEERYTFFELFRILNYISDYLIINDVEVNGYPNIFNENINNWINYIENHIESEILHSSFPMSGNFIGVIYPEFILLYKFFILYAQQEIKQVIEECIKNILDFANDIEPDEYNIKIKRYFDIGNDLTIFNILMPALPDFSNIVSKNSLLLKIIDYKEPYQKLMDSKWTKNTMSIFFSENGENIPTSLYNSIIGEMTKLIDDIGINTYMDSSFYNSIRNAVEIIAVEKKNDILPYITMNNFKREIFPFWKLIIPMFGKVLDDISIANIYKKNLEKLQQKKITDTFFLTETYGYFFYLLRKKLDGFARLIRSINNIIADTNAFINNKTYYHIPQIFMPALIKQIIVVAGQLVSFKKFIDQMAQKKEEFYSLINATDSNNQNIIGLGDEIFKKISDNLVEFYKSGLLEIVKYHNTIIDFLNMHSAYRLINLDQSDIKKFFSGNLTPIQNFPDKYIEGTDIKLLKKIIDAYSTADITYYANKNELKNAPQISKIIKSNYQNIIKYLRDGQKKSNLPTIGQNYQINMIKKNNGSIVITKDFSPIAGKWLNIDYKNPSKSLYADALINYTEKKYVFDKTQGMPVSIKSFAGPYIKNMKQIIIQDIIQYIIDEYAKAKGNKEIVKMYDQLKSLANENTYNDISNIKVYIIIGQLADAIINRLLDYSIRQSITSWIYSFASTNSKFNSVINKIKNTIEIINQKDYQKLSLNNVDKNEIENLAKTDDKYLDFSLMQIESDPKELPFVTKPVDKEFIYYLYNINYYSSSNINTREKCRQINPKIAEKLINDKTLNSKNSDGKTPLQYAVEIGHPDLVKRLVSRGANPHGFYNIKGQNAYDIAIQNIKEFLKYTIAIDTKSSVYNTIENFAVPFNDLLATRLKDDKFGNNIIKNVTMAIPIQLIMYNHMFKLYLENYRYGFSSELKKSFKSVVGKRYNYYDFIYPVDLFQVDDETQLLNISKKNNINLTIKNNINKGNKKKIDSKEKLIAQLQIQIDGLAEEKKKTDDSEQIKFIEELSNTLTANRDKYKKDLEKILIKKEPKLDKGLMEIYLNSVDSISKAVIDRSYDIVQFYDYGFSRVSRNKDFYAAVWDNYIHKDLKNAPSMIFSVVSDTMLHIINNDLLIRKSSSNDKLYISHTDVMNDFNKIVDFLKVVRDYIESKDSFPNDKIDPEENPILAQECEQIVYLINLILTPALRNILLGQIYQSIKEMDALGEIISDQRVILDEILSTKFNGETLDSFLNKILPKRMYKYVTNSYISDYDPDRKILNGSDIFEPIIELVKQFRVVQVTDESILVKNIKDYLIPFMINTYQNFIHHLQLTIYGYERYLLNMYQNAVIMQTLMQYETKKKI